MQLLFDFLPVIAFFVAYKLTDIFVATGVLVAAVLVLIFGGLTLAVHDKAFIQWKVTIVNWLFAVAFLVGNYIGERPLTQRIMGESVTLERAAWRRLSWAWIVYFLAL